ncbi:P-loop ATPase, Sll1717 family [Pararhodobacter sp.]|uniref:P-loop ATPase, Sll1717 family n=1 Tax=Pararhodobacter sp. TaxID=2127056 RepID=UPI002AFF7887|nr:hypothetical protein [Pararhodobacter sp.]
MNSILDRLTERQCETLKAYVNNEQPFGPENAKLVKDDYSRFVLFNDDNVFSQEYRSNPRIIIGRRGSGKTTITSNTKFIDEHTYILNVQPEEALATIQAIAFPNKGADGQYVESIAKIWKVFFNTLLMVELCKKHPGAKLSPIKKYLAQTKIPIESTLVGVMGAFRNKAENLGNGVASFVISAFLEALNNSDSGYVPAKDELDRYLSESDETAIIIIDSIEDYHLSIPEKKHVMGGLLKCVGEFGDQRRSIRLCLPAESYFEVRKCSKNPLKDFNRNLLLQWLASEIFGVIAWRYQIFNRLYDRTTYDKLKLNGYDRSGSLKTIHSLLPQSLTNGIGLEEPTITYLMRHTQLLPRQAILILNTMFYRANGKLGGLSQVSGQDIVRAITSVESTLCEEVFTAYEHKYPLAYELAKNCLPELHRTFSDGDLHRVYNRHGKVVFDKANEELDFREFKTMLVEIGAVGRVKNRTGIYAESEFEYAMPGRLSLSVEDELCLHPIFSGEFSSSKNSSNGFVVYPQKEWVEGESGRSLRITIGDR